MNKKSCILCALVLVGTFIVIPNLASAPAAYNAYVYTFEYDSEGWTVGGAGQWEREISSHCISPLYSYHGYRDTTNPGTSWLTSPSIRFPNSPDLKVFFANYRRFISPGDVGELRIRTAWGSWSILETYTTDTAGSDMVFEEVPVPSFYHNAWVELRFAYSAVAGSPNYEGWFIDEIIVQGSLHPTDPDTDGDGLSDAAEENMVFSDLARYTFESEYWSGLGLWERTDARYHSRYYGYHCGRSPTIPTNNYLASPEIQLPNSPRNYLLSYWIYLDLIPASLDMIEVRIRVIGGPWDITIGYHDYASDPQEVWIQEAIPIDGYFVNAHVKVVFYFHSDDGNENIYEGVYVDDVSLSAVTNPLTYDSDNDGVKDGDEGDYVDAHKYTFEYDSEDWVGDGLWQRETERSHSPLYAYHCGRDPVLPYDSYLTSPVIKLPMSPMLYISYWYWLDMGPLLDSGELRMDIVGGQQDISLVSYGLTDPQQVWTYEIVGLTDYADELVQFRFLFHSGVGNPSDEGWFIDDIIIVGSMNPLNPDTDHDTVRDGIEDEFNYPAWGYDFDTGSQGWQEGEGLWEVTTSRYHSSPNSFHAGRDSYSSSSNSLTSQVIRLPNSPRLTVSFYHFMDFIPHMDSAIFMIRIAGSPWWSWSLLSEYMASDPGESGWVMQDPIDITAYADEWVQFRFLFLSYPGDQGTYEGWYVDDFSMEGHMNPLSQNTDGDKRGDGLEYEMWSLWDDWRSPVGPNSNYAVMMTGSSDFDAGWNDLRDWYYLLRMNDFEKEDIIVLYVDGEDEEQTSESPIVDFDSTRLNLDAAFEEVSTMINVNDFLLIWTMSHGEVWGGSHRFQVHDTSEWVYSEHFGGSPEPGSGRIYTGHVQVFGRRVILATHCNSGNMFIQHLSDQNTVVETCGDLNDECPVRPQPWPDGEEHADFTYYTYLAFVSCPEEYDVDADDNGHVSFVEAYNYAQWKLLILEWEISHPVYDDNGDGLGMSWHMPFNLDGYLGINMYF